MKWNKAVGGGFLTPGAWIRGLRRKDSPRLWLYELELLDKLAQPGCPICARMERDDQSYFFWLFYESYFDPGVLDRFSASFGFCPAHAAHATRHTGGARQLAYMHAHFARKTMSLLARQAGVHELNSALISPLPCPACESSDGTARRSASSLAHLLQDRGWAERYGQPGLVCFPHLRLLAAHLSADLLLYVLDMHVDAMAALAHASGSTDVEAALALLAGRDAWVAPATLRVNPEPRRPDPLWDFAASLERTDMCLVCLEASRAWHEWTAWLNDAAAKDQDIADLLPTCPEHVRGFVRIGGEALALAVIRNGLRVVLGQTRFARKALSPQEIHGHLVERIRFKLLDTPRHRHENAIEMLQQTLRCPVCERLATAQTRAIDLFLVLLQQPQHEAAFQRGYGLCMKHFLRASSSAPNQTVRSLLLRVQSAKLACLEWDLEEARRKDILFARPETPGTERSAWLRALSRFSGSWEPFGGTPEEPVS
jgi:hypothetical protein